MILIKAFIATFGVMLGLIAFVFVFNLLGEGMVAWKRWKMKRKMEQEK